MIYKMIKPPLSITLQYPNNIVSAVYSIDEPTFIDINSSHYADIVPLDEFVKAETIDEKTKVIKNSKYLDIVREINEDNSIGCLFMNIWTNLYLIVDNDREITLNNITLNENGKIIQ